MTQKLPKSEQSNFVIRKIQIITPKFTKEALKFTETYFRIPRKLFGKILDWYLAWNSTNELVIFWYVFLSAQFKGQNSFSSCDESLCFIYSAFSHCTVSALTRKNASMYADNRAYIARACRQERHLRKLREHNDVAKKRIHGWQKMLQTSILKPIRVNVLH